MTSQEEKYPLVSIITVNYNALDATLELLASIENITYPKTEVFVVDNASKIDPREEINRQFKSVNVINSNKNLGFAGGNNLGIAKATGEFLLFINNDAVLTPGCIEVLVDTFRKYPKTGIVSPKFHYYYKPGIIEFAGYTDINSITGRNNIIGGDLKDTGQFDELKETPFCHGGCMLVSKEVIEEVGPIPEEYFLYYEEFDWCEKIRNKGYKIYYQPKALVRHKVSETIGKESTLKTYYLTRNRILFMRRNKNILKYFLFIFYFICVALPKNIFAFLLKKKPKHLSVFLWAVAWNFGVKKKMNFNN